MREPVALARVFFGAMLAGASIYWSSCRVDVRSFSLQCLLFLFRAEVNLLLLIYLSLARSIHGIFYVVLLFLFFFFFGCTIGNLIDRIAHIN